MQNNPDYLLLELLSMDPKKKLTKTLNIQIKQVSQLYEHYQNSVRNGKLGKTAMFWLTYLDLFKCSMWYTCLSKRMILKRDCLAGSTFFCFTLH